MPYELTWEREGVVKHFWGDVSGNELAESVEEVAAHPRFDGLRFILNDFLDVGKHIFDADSMFRILVSRIGSRYSNPNIRVLLVTTDADLFALSNGSTPGAFPTTNETKSFTSVAEAREWLSRQPPLHEGASSGSSAHRSVP